MPSTPDQHAHPVAPDRRAVSIDALRGLGILGILLVNIQYFGMGLMHKAPNPSDLDHLVRALVAILCESKFVTIFSLLFGAGIVLMDQSAQRKGERWTGRFLMRTGILLVMGFLHAYLLWYGDILFTYALIGFVVFWFRRLHPALLIGIGCAWYALGLLATGWIFALDSEGYPVPTAVEFAAARAGDLPRIMVYALIALYYQTGIFLLFSAWFNTGLMLVGMGLCKLGFLQGSWRTKRYLIFIALGLLVALPLIALAYQTRPGGAGMSLAWAYTNLALAPFVSLAYCSILILACTRKTPNLAANALASVGRTALTNYLLQSVLCVIIFYHLGQIGRHNDATVQTIALAILALQLVASPLWLKAFRFGPMEWLWRSLTYREFEPMRRRATPT
ncbi:MAG: DUF418 domain-containing protein [Phycisphaerales bacterium]